MESTYRDVNVHIVTSSTHISCNFCEIVNLVHLNIWLVDVDNNNDFLTVYVVALEEDNHCLGVVERATVEDD